MAKGSGSAIQASSLLVLAFLCLLIQSEIADATVYNVGDSKGWTPNIAAWPNTKKFRAGDWLVFKYNPVAHNVVPVNAAGYNSCKTPRGARVLTSGSDRVRLARGKNYFICSIPGHCQSGMKIAVTAM